MNYKNRINTGFAGCLLLAHARDNCRNRDVRLYLLPEGDDCVGVADGTDAWIAPVSAAVFSVNVERLIADIRAGKGLPAPRRPTPRRSLPDEVVAAAGAEVIRRTRRALDI